MNNDARLRVYQAQTQNVRSLVSARTQVRRAINLALRENRQGLVPYHTKTLALIFCAWTEAIFSKTIHTPHGFSLIEIAQIKAEVRGGSVVDGWNKCITLALSKNAAKKSNFSPNARRSLERLVDELVRDPSIIRNKIAHGQWECPLNRGNTDVNIDIQNKIKEINVVKIEEWFECLAKLCEIVELLIESPNRAFMASYWNLITSIDQIRAERANWTVETKSQKLSSKRRKRGGPEAKG